jgi:glutathione S-transferase
MTYTLHGSLTSPFVRKACSVFGEKGVAYSLALLDVFAPPPAFDEISPLRRIPVLTFDGYPGRPALPDSSAICAYLEAAYPAPPLLESDPYDRARALWIEEFSDTNFAYRLGFSVTRPILFGGAAGIDHAKMADDIARKINPLLAYLETQIEGRTWFVAERFGLADIAIGTQLAGLIHCRRLDILDPFPGLAGLLDRAMQRPVLERLVADAAAYLAARAPSLGAAE